ncbi:7-cyano-7-deazaguanine synthase QueC [Rubripirellula sp.]|jgi:7-cyano-7-deazaguanine synthase|nr:7-cyano-7-deazaguanine synthase QueC [Rubripirellula sp.]MDB4639361.1 7-cyano-7-deazaguanine synthase QueC [bacterium]MDA9934167.1 7-cyano-7-deazaguanine synthase QueC [Rubripirellula sp.]MDB4654115.1 7-cyano-7-deazaguanine synthase QueC [bacterium]MDB4654637.1 7-cyano-7-deazaguanine synthase QueC [Rubripirellula sp.]MDC0317657.1 7-cyano-7-deazaguanine synthase QueC [bacterium]
MSSLKRAVILLSGGLDSATCLAIARNEGFETHTVAFRYGQRHQYELQRAQLISEKFNATSHRIVDIDLAQFGGSALTDSAIDVPKSETVESIGQAIPVTYVPARNTVFLSLSLAFAETVDAKDVFIGVNSLDYSGYPDCRPEFIQAFEHMANLATKAGVEESQRLKIHTPLIDLTKAEIIARGMELGVDYGLTLSCYDPGGAGRPCEHCDACLLRARGFATNGIQDPALVGG